jgi:biotin carboxylase
MHPATTLLLIGGTDEMVQKAQALGLRVLVLQHPERIAEAPCELADLVRIADYTDLAELELAARELHDSHGFTAAVSLTEAGLEGAGWINDRFGLGGTGFAVARLMRDKWAMRRRLAGSGLPTVGAAPLADRADIDRFAAQYGYPFIVKPVDGTGSYGVVRVDGPHADDAVWAMVAARRGHRMDRTSMPFAIGGFMMEEYVDGPEFSVESFSFAGRHVVVAITEKFVSRDHFTELGHALPARLDPAADASMRRAVGRFLDTMGLLDGVGHTEVRLGARGPVVIETHNRIGGDAIHHLVRGAYGIDLITYAVGWPFRLVPELPDVPSAHGGASTLCLVSEPGRVESVTGIEEALATEDVLAVQMWAQPGAMVRAPRDNWNRLGLVAVTAADTAAAIRRGTELLRDTIRIQVRGQDGTIRPARIAIAPEGSQVPEPAAPVAAGLASGLAPGLEVPA